MPFAFSVPLNLLHKYHFTEFVLFVLFVDTHFSASGTLNPYTSTFTGDAHGVAMAVEHTILLNSLLNTIMSACSMGLEITIAWAPCPRGVA